MPVTSDHSIFDERRIDRETFVTVLERAGSFPTPLWNGTPRGNERETAGELYDLVVSKNQDPAFWLAICAEEHSFGTNPNSVMHRNDTRSWTNARTVRDPSFSGTATIITDPIRNSQYVKYASVVDSLKDGVFRVSDPNFVYVQEGRRSIGQIIKRWAPEGDSQRYIDKTVERINAWSGANGDDLPRSKTDRMIATLRARGLEVHDMRGQLPINPNPAHHYDTMPLSEVRYIIHHWTGDTFTRETIRNITGSDYGMDVIPPTMSVQDEIDMLRWYANLHIARDDKTWGGIAYGVMVFPSGRVYVNWDIGTFTYHAWHGANRQSYATCCPNANAAAPHPAQLLALQHVWDILCFETPEIPAGREQLFGHLEAKFLDPRNDTACPGTFLPHVVAYREGTTRGELRLPHPTHERHFGEVSFFIQFGFKNYWERLEQKGEVWQTAGYPRSNEIQVTFEDKQRTVQLFDRCAFIWEPENTPPWDVHHATGTQYVEILRQIGQLP
jgi:hypothetical protein